MQSEAISSATTDRLWAVVSDVERWPDLMAHFTAVVPEPVVPERGTSAGSVRATSNAVVPERGTGTGRVGRRYRVRQPGLAPAVYEITGWEAGHSFDWTARLPGIVTTARHRVEPDPAGSRVILELGWTGLLGGIVERLVGVKAQRMIDSEARTFASVAAADGRDGAKHRD